mgnify:FL=1
MKRRSHRRQFFLFVAAVILPCVVLVAAGVRMVDQERELAEARLLQERSRVARQLGQDLLIHLNQVWVGLQREIGEGTPRGHRPHAGEVVFAAEMREGELFLPWKVATPGPGPGDVPLIQRGERQELGAGDVEAAALTYQLALEDASDQGEASLARLYLARALAGGNRLEEALDHYRVLLALHTGITDNLGMPFSYYAAERLLSHGAGEGELIRFVTREARGSSWTVPSATHLLHDVATALVETFAAGSERDSAAVAEVRLAARVQESEQILDLADDLHTLELPMGGGTGLTPDWWMLYGAEPWLVGLGPTEDGNSLLVSVDAEQVLQVASSNQGGDLLGLALAPEWATDGLMLDPRLRGLRVNFTLPEAEGLEGAVSRQRAFYSVITLLVVGFTLFGGYLLWRDVQREVGMARLRSQFVSGVSHELRTPLTSIRMFAETLLHRGPEDRETHEEFLGTIVDESNRLSRLLGNVLEFSAIERGKRQYQMQSRDLGEILQAAIKAIQQRLDSEGFVLTTSFDGGIPPALSLIHI